MALQKVWPCREGLRGLDADGNPVVLKRDHVGYMQASTAEHHVRLGNVRLIQDMAQTAPVAAPAAPEAIPEEADPVIEDVGDVFDD